MISGDPAIINAVLVAAPRCEATQVPNSDHSSANSITGVLGTSLSVTCDTGFDGGGEAICGSNLEFDLPDCDLDGSSIATSSFLFWSSSESKFIQPQIYLGFIFIMILLELRLY